MSIITAPVSPIIPQSSVGELQSGFDEILVQAVGPDANSDSVNQFRSYDLAVKEWFQGISHFRGQTIPMFKESPMRAYSTYKQLLDTQKVTPVILSEDGRSEVDKLPLPFITFQRGDTLARQHLQNQSWPMRNLTFLPGTKQRRTAYSRYPRPITLPYQIDLWCRYENHANYFHFKILEQFDGMMAWWSVLNPVIGDKMLMGIQDRGIHIVSDMESDKDKIIHITLSIHVEAWLFFDVMAAPTFEISTKIYDIQGDISEPSVSTPLTPLAPSMTAAQIAALPSNPVSIYTA